MSVWDALKRKIKMRFFVMWMIAELEKRELELDRKRYHRQDRKEQRRRILQAEELFVRLREVKEESFFCSAFAEDAVVAVFNGDLKEAKTLTEMIDPDHENSKGFRPGSLEHMRPLVEALKAMLTEVEA